MKRILVLLAAVILVVIAILFNSCCESNKPRVHKIYVIKITYCDVRQPDTIEVSTWCKPDNYMISNYKKAVPEVNFWINGEYHTYLNVCDIKTLKTIEKYESNGSR